MTKNKAEIVLFETEDKKLSFPVEVKGETVWLSANQMAALFERDEKTIRKHINNVFKENEVEKEYNTQKMRVVGVSQLVPFYSLEVIISVGYRVKSNRGVEFRRWANSVLKQYILQGYAINQKRIQQARIREHREFVNKIVKAFRGTEYEKKTDIILKFIERHDAKTPMILYTGSLHEFGREDGRAIYQMLKQVV